MANKSVRARDKANLEAIRNEYMNECMEALLQIRSPAGLLRARLLLYALLKEETSGATAIEKKRCRL